MPSYSEQLHQEDCMLDNRERLKQVMNLEDLVKFKVKSFTHPKAQNKVKQSQLPILTKPETTFEQADLPSLYEIQQDQIKYLKKQFGIKNNQFKEFKVKNLNPVMNKYSHSQQRPESEPQSMKEYKQKLLKMKEEHENAPYQNHSIELDFLPLMMLDPKKQQRSPIQRQDQFIDQQPSNSKVTTGQFIDYTDQWEPYVKPFVLGKNQTSNLSKIALTRQKEYIQYPDHLKKINELSKKQQIAQSKVHQYKEKRQRYLNEKHNLYGHSALPEKQRSHSIDYRPKTEFHQTKASALPSAYYTHISDKFQPSMPRLQGFSTSDFSSIKVTKVDLTQKVHDAKSSQGIKRIPNLRSQSMTAETTTKPKLNKVPVQAEVKATSQSQESSSDERPVPKKTIINLGKDQSTESMIIANNWKTDLTQGEILDEVQTLRVSEFILKPNAQFYKSHSHFTAQKQMGAQSIPTFQIAPFESERFKRYPRFNIHTAANRDYQSLGQTVISLNTGFQQVARSSQLQADLLTPIHPENSPDLIKQTSTASLEQYYPPSRGDPFDSVTVEKHIDNALLTSNRTVYGLNNTISSSLKIVHNKFNPIVQNDYKTAVGKAKKHYLKHQLYEVKEIPHSQEIGTEMINDVIGKAYQYPNFSQVFDYSKSKEVEHEHVINDQLFEGSIISTQKNESQISDKLKLQKHKNIKGKRQKQSFTGMGVQGTVILSSKKHVQSHSNSPVRDNKVIEVLVEAEALKPTTVQSMLLSEQEPHIIQSVKDPLYIIQQMKALLTQKIFEEPQLWPNKVMTNNVVFSQKAELVNVTGHNLLRESILSAEISDVENLILKLQDKTQINVQRFNQVLTKRKFRNSSTLGLGNISSEAISPVTTPQDKEIVQISLTKNLEIQEQSFPDSEASLDLMMRPITTIATALKELMQEPTIVSVPQDSENEKIILRSLEQDLGSNGRQLKVMIDKLYAKEKQLIYARLNLRDECVSAGDIIFNLGKCHNLKSKQGTTSTLPNADIDLVSCAVRGTKFEIKEQ